MLFESVNENLILNDFCQSIRNCVKSITQKLLLKLWIIIIVFNN